MRIIAIFLFSSLIFQGCATQAVMQKANGINLYLGQLKSVQFDDTRKEFTLCLEGYSHPFLKTRFQKPEYEGWYMLKIPEGLATNQDKDRYSFRERNVYEYMPGNSDQQNDRPNYQVRKDIHVYEINPQVEPGCFDISGSTEVTILRTPTDIDYKDAWQFKGEKVNEMLLKNRPFAIAAPALASDFRPGQFSLCHSDRELHETCLLLVTKPQGDATNQKVSTDQRGNISEIISIRKMRSTKFA